MENMLPAKTMPSKNLIPGLNLPLAVETVELSKKYGSTTVVNRLNLRVPQGAVYGLLGPNGAGKSTTMKMLLALNHASSGEIKIFDRVLGQKNRVEILAQTGSLIENPGGYPNLTASENLEIIRLLKGGKATDIAQALSIVRLDDKATKKKRISQFSLGMKQRLGIAMALMGKPALLILDEPTNGLDPAGIHEMRELIKNLPGMINTTVIVSSHLLSEIDQMADYVGIINQGNLVWQGSLANLHARGRKWLRLRTSNNQQACLLHPELIPDKNRSDWLLCPALDDTACARFSLQLAQENIAVLRIEEQRENLEDIFLQLTSERFAQ